MKVIVIGPGALGCLLAAKLSWANEVWLLDHDAERAAQLAGSGVLLEEGGQFVPCAVRATSNPELLGAADVALLCVKSHQIKAAVVGARPALRQAGLLLVLANGIGHLEVLNELCQGLCWGVGVTAQGATLLGTGRVVHRGEGETKIGFPPGQNTVERPTPAWQKRLLTTAEVLTQAGVPTEAVADILPPLWGKLLVNVGINALTAIHGCPNGGLLESPRLLALLTAAVQEGAQVAEKIGVELPGDPVAGAKEVCRVTAANISSMLQDVRAGRRTEIAAINGAVVRMAKALGVPVPVNEELLAKVQDLENN
ncbi:MAG: 2-dehydropantoate 2-reductase [Desulfobulbaceae bacterium]|nr:2-dehydropantoate 2-reductase [Desulfobulbaceae bacterium]